MAIITKLEDCFKSKEAAQEAWDEVRERMRLIKETAEASDDPPATYDKLIEEYIGIKIVRISEEDLEKLRL